MPLSSSRLYVKDSNGDAQNFYPVTTAVNVLYTTTGGTDTNLKDHIDALSNISGSMVFKGFLDGTSKVLPSTDYKAGWQYKVEVAGTYAGVACKAGDTITCTKDYASGTAANGDWFVTHENSESMVVAENVGTVKDIAVFDGTGTTSRNIKSVSIGDLVKVESSGDLSASTSDGVLTISHVKPATSGFTAVAAADKALYKVAYDDYGHIIDSEAVTNVTSMVSDVVASTSGSGGSNGLMTAAQAERLAAITDADYKNSSLAIFKQYTVLDGNGANGSGVTASASIDSIAFKPAGGDDPTTVAINANNQIVIGHSNSVTAQSSQGLYKVAFNATGHITGASLAEKADIDALIGNASSSAAGLMSSAHYDKVEGIAAGAEVNQNAVAKVTVGTTSIEADTKSDEVKFAVSGSGLSAAADASSSTVTFTHTPDIYYSTVSDFNASTLATAFNGIPNGQLIVAYTNS